MKGKVLFVCLPADDKIWCRPMSDFIRVVNENDSFCCTKSKGLPPNTYEKFNFFAKKFCEPECLATFVRLLRVTTSRLQDSTNRENQRRAKDLAFKML